MLSSPVELAIHRNGTKRFIDADPTEIILRPANQATIVDGTLKAGATPNVRDAQLFKIIFSGSTGIAREISSGEGQARSFDFILVGEHDATVEIGDTFYHGTNKYVVEYIFPDNGYEVKCGGISHGSKPT